MESIERRVGGAEKKEGDADRKVGNTEKSWKERKCCWKAPRKKSEVKGKRMSTKQEKNMTDSLPTSN